MKLSNQNFKSITAEILNKTKADVENALNSSILNLDDFKALLSPIASDYLEPMAEKSINITRKRFGNVIDMYAPLYVSNECQNICTYCGFSFNNKIERLTLNEEQILTEVEVVKKLGFDHVLVVSGEATKTVGIEYFSKVIDLIKPHFSQISFEVQPLDQNEYEILINKGLHSVMVYQETYDRDTYKEVHPKGKKSNFEYRLETPDRLGKAGIHKIGLGVLLGLSDWRADSFMLANHLDYLRKTYWKTKFSISFPRLRPASGVTHPKLCINEKELTQLILAFRLFDENLELSLSTRESEYYRNNIASLGVTSMSAGSKTDPGGYASTKKALKQFDISDERTPSEVSKMLISKGLEPVWKNWDRVLQKVA
ncbi:UNVERIFIED_CONTAM: hypothetical protein GTU68_047668 [Idotea baltica]|nr:hypothetical protein [Idotea baltica]